MPDSAAAVYQDVLLLYSATPNTEVPAWARRSFALRRLAAFDGEVGEQAREQLRADWADAESEFLRRVAEPILRGTNR